MIGQNYCAVYDFELFPYALGDVLTWNVETAIRCEESGRERVDTYVCLDDRHPSSIFQKDVITAENCDLFFNDLFGAFGTHPKPGSFFLYRRREEMLARLREVSNADAVNAAYLADYERALANRGVEAAVIDYFTQSMHSHERINRYASVHGRLPLLRPSRGCEADVAGLIAKRLPAKRIVAIHPRLRRLDAGYGAEQSYWRDSDFLEWYEFLREAEKGFPDVQFVVMGRLQEKPLELLRLPNVISLRTLGLGLGHELTLMLKSDLFIGTSSGFATLAYFSGLPYFMTNVNHTACKAYQIAPGAERLPFATERQFLIYEPETRELLMKLLERGLKDVPQRRGTPGPPSDGAIDVRGWEWERSQWLFPGATTSRFVTDDAYSDKETAFLVWPKVREARAAWLKGSKDQAWTILQRLYASFPRMCERFPEYLRLMATIAGERNEQEVLRRCNARLDDLPEGKAGLAGLLQRLGRLLHWTFPYRKRLEWVWRHKHRIPGKALSIIVRLATRRVSA